MAKKVRQQDASLERLEHIKRLAIVAMFSEDELLKHLVLKGGNALDLVHKISTRASADIDFSMKNDFPGGEAEFRKLVEKALVTTFKAEGYQVFDVRMQERPATLSPEVAEFWGGYGAEFKLVESARYDEFKGDLEALRPRAINLGRGTRFLIDVSKFEFTDGKEKHDFDGYRIFVYSAPMMVCEKLRAICQQLPEYNPIVHRDRPGSPRARDFVDIQALIELFKIDLMSAENQKLLVNIFSAKRVPLGFLGKISSQREFHRQDFPSVVDTVKPGVKLGKFDEYFDFTVGLSMKLKPLWDV